MSFEWERFENFPEQFNTGVLLSTAKAVWLRNVLDSFKLYRGEVWCIVGCSLPYKVYEQYPDEVYLDRHLAVSL